MRRYRPRSRLSRRYLTGRQLPDKAVDLLDTASARVRMSLDCEPQALVRLKARQAALELERQALEEDRATRWQQRRRASGARSLRNMADLQGEHSELDAAIPA